MAIHYNLSKVYAISLDDSDFVNQVISVFIKESFLDLGFLKNGIKEKNHKQVQAYAHKIKPSLDLMGLNIAFENIKMVEDWAKNLGKKKEIKDTFKIIKHHLKKAIKEMKKDFNLPE